MSKHSIRSFAALSLAVLVASPALAVPQRGGGGARSSANTSVNRGGNTNRNTNVNQNRNTNVNTNVNRNTNVNVNRDVDVNVNHYGGYGYGGCCYHPVATAAAVTAATVATAAVVGSIVTAASMPTGCVTTVVGGVAYQQCGSTWYQPQFVGGATQYVVVTHP